MISNAAYKELFGERGVKGNFAEECTFRSVYYPVVRSTGVQLSSALLDGVLSQNKICSIKSRSDDIFHRIFY